MLVLLYLNYIISILSSDSNHSYLGPGVTSHVAEPGKPPPAQGLETS